MRSEFFWFRKAQNFIFIWRLVVNSPKDVLGMGLCSWIHGKRCEFIPIQFNSIEMENHLYGAPNGHTKTVIFIRGKMFNRMNPLAGQIPRMNKTSRNRKYSRNSNRKEPSSVILCPNAIFLRNSRIDVDTRKILSTFENVIFHLAFTLTRMTLFVCTTRCGPLLVLFHRTHPV